MPGKVTIIVVSRTKTTKELENDCHSLLHSEGGWYLGNEPDEVESYVVPSDDTEEQIKEEYF